MNSLNATPMFVQTVHVQSCTWAARCSTGLLIKLTPKGVVLFCCSVMQCHADTLAVVQVKQAWDFAYQQLTAPSDPSESLLERIIRVDTVLTDRPRPADPEVPEQLEQQIRDEMHHRSKRSRREHKHRDKESRHGNQDKEKDREGRHKDKKRRRERSLEFSDPDPDVHPDRDRTHRSSSRDENKRQRRHKDHKLRKSDRHRSSREVSPCDVRHTKHIRFSE